MHCHSLPEACDVCAAALTALTHLDVSMPLQSHGITDADMEHICYLTQLRSLDISQSKFSEAGAALLSRMTCLTQLRVHCCDGMSIDSLAQLKHLPLVYLGTDHTVEDVASIDMPLAMAVFRSNRASNIEQYASRTQPIWC